MVIDDFIDSLLIRLISLESYIGSKNCLRCVNTKCNLKSIKIDAYFKI